MAENNQVVEQEVVETPEVEEGVVQQEVEETPEVEELPDITPEDALDEERAMAAGWKPKDQWEGDPKKWVPADEFNRRGELFGKIDSLSHDLRETKKVLRLMQDHHAKVAEVEYERALKTLKEQKRRAMIEGDTDAVVDIDDRIIDMKAARKANEDAPQEQRQTVDPRFVQWTERNGWYNQDNELRAFADEVGLAHARANPDKAPEDVLKYVEQRVRRVYPDKFTNPNRSRPSAVAGREAQGGGGRKQDDFQLTEDERKVMNALVKEGVMTKDEYIADIKKVRGAV